MLKTIALLSVLFGITAHAETLKINLDRACAYADDRVFEGEQIEFQISTHSHGYAQKQDSPALNITPGYCMAAKHLSNYTMNVAIDDVGSPLEINISKQVVGKISKLSYHTIIVGTEAQLLAADCSNEDHECINVSDLKTSCKDAEITTTEGFKQRRKTGVFNLSLQLI